MDYTRAMHLSILCCVWSLRAVNMPTICNLP